MARRAAPRMPEPPADAATHAAGDAGTHGRATPHERLATYRAKRDFAVTAEPRGATTDRPSPPAGSSRFVVQRHRARRLHYDLRLEMGGVLVSWAVPRGPTLDPAARHMAIHVEDHPLEYFDFEGVIPAGEYGGGDVIVWDWGTWAPSGTDDPLRAVADGELHADLVGEKLRGRFVLVRTDGRRRGASTRSSGAATARTSGCCCTNVTTTPWTVGIPSNTRGR